MELVYLWIENYKNIHHQGFNFSPRFHCEYDEKENKLTIEENDDYIPNFFGENINVTAIVGKNGSGKSTLVRLLEEGVYDSNFVKIFYFNGNFLYLNDNFLDIKCNYPLKAFYSDEEFLENLRISLFQAENPYLKNEENMENTYSLILDSNHIVKLLLKYNYKKLSKFFVPKYCVIDPLIDKDFLSILYKEVKKMSYSDTMFSAKKAISNFEHDFRYLSKRHSDPHPYYWTEKLFWLYALIKIEDKIDENIFDKELFIKNIAYFYDENSNLSLTDIEKFIFRYSSKSFYEYKALWTKDDNFSLISKDLNLDLIFKYFDLLDIGIFDENELWIEDLSHGEKNLLGIFLNILDAIDMQKDNFVFLDESDLAFHPQWQKEYINLLTQFLKDNVPQVKVHLILTTHSPFLLSDIPKDNIIFLDKDEKGNCKVINRLKTKEQTFGANIHTLLSDSFFMENGLIGEFAKNKINGIKKLYQLSQNKSVQEKLENQKIKELAQKAFNRRKNRLWQIQKIIGEPFLQKVIKNYLDELELLFSDDNTLIAKELAEIEERKKYLKALQKRKE